MELRQISIEIKGGKDGARRSVPSRQIPALPGVYCFLDEDGGVLYVGKARDLRARVMSYFRSRSSMAAKTRLMMDKAAALKLTVTASEKEALILEAELISSLKPRYNIMLRDDKAYPFLRLGIKSRWPRLHMVRKRRRDGALYFGPYTSSRALRQTLRFLSHAFRLRSCTDHVLKGRKRPCLLYQIERCSGPCAGMVSSREYQEQVRAVRLFLEGRASEVIRRLKEQMESAAEALEFERAAMFRDRIKAIERTLEAQAVIGPMSLDLDVATISERGSDMMVSLLSVRQGRVVAHELFEMRGELEEGGLGQALSLFLRQHYCQAEPPSEIVLSHRLEDMDALADILTERRRAVRSRAGRVRLTLPERGIRRRLLERAQENARQALAAMIRKEEDWGRLSELMKKRLGLRKRPEAIEGVDISTFGGEASVGSLVRFEQGREVKGGYRHYGFRQIEGVDDFAMIGQVIERRLRSGFSRGDLPDLFLIDGGKGQLNAALAAMEELRPQLADAMPEAAALAKERGDRGERIFLPGRQQPLVLRPEDPVLLFLQRVRDEAHRFGIEANRRRRVKTRLKSRITEVPGIGPKRAGALLSRFGSVRRIAEAEPAQICQVQGISMELARKIKEHLNAGGPSGRDRHLRHAE